MAKYRQKPVDAYQWYMPDGFMGDHDRLGVPAEIIGREPGGIHRITNPIWHFYVLSSHGEIRIEDGDWILPEPDGKHYYPCKSDIFDANYEKVEDDDMPALHDNERQDMLSDLSGLLNKYAAENASNTPDFILAEFLMGCLDAFNAAHKRCRQWEAPDGKRA